MEGDLKLTFIQVCLRQYMDSVMQGMKIAAQRAGVGVTQQAINSLAAQVVQSGGGARASLSFDEALRFVDMGVGRGHPLGGLKTMRVTLLHRSGRVQAKDNTRKAKKIYSKVAYGKLTYLENRLLHGYTEETITALKQMQTTDN